MKVFLGPLTFLLLIFALEVSSLQMITRQAAQSNPCSNCLNCTAAQICTDCNPGFFVDQAGQCIACSPNCETCVDANTCSVCLDEYTLNSNNVCVHNLLCPANCSVCSDNTTCTTCLDGFYLAPNSVCQACPISRAACINPATCTDCAEGYSITELNTCKPVQILQSALNATSNFTWISLAILVLLTVQHALTPLHVPLVPQASFLIKTTSACLVPAALTTASLVRMVFAQFVTNLSILTTFQTNVCLVLKTAWNVLSPQPAKLVQLATSSPLTVLAW